MKPVRLGWTAATLGEFGKWGSGGTPKRTENRYYAGGTIPWLVIGDLNDSVVRSAATHITPEALQESAAKIVPTGTLLVAMYGSIGKSGIAGMPCATNQAIAHLQPESELDHRYTFRLLQWLRPSLIAQGKGGAQQNISQEVLRSQIVPVAPANEQRRIADKLDTVLARVDEVKDRLDRVAPLLKRFRQSVLAAATSGKLTEDWRIAAQVAAPLETTLGALIKVSSGDGLTAKEMRQGDVPVFGGNGVNGYHDEGNTNGPQIVIGRVGYYCGSVHLTPAKAWVTDNALIVRFDTNVISRQFLYYGLLGTNLRENTSSTAQPVISGQKIYPLAFRLPALPEQAEIVRRVELLFGYADRLEARLQAAQTAADRLTPALLAKAFRGELVPQDPNDEPASELLKRLAAARDTSASPRRGRGRKASAGIS